MRLQISRLKCPSCQSPYPLWRLLVRCRWHVCRTCKSRLDFTVESAQRLGAVGGALGAVVLFPLIFIVGRDIIRSWQFWALLVVCSYVAGAVISALVCRFGLYEQLRATTPRWDVFPNVSARHRKFLWAEFIIVPPCAIFLTFARSLPVWLIVAVSLLLIFAAVFGSIGSWHLFFGKQGIFTRWRSDHPLN